MNVEKFLTGGVYRRPQIDGEIKIEPLFNAHKLANLCLSEAVDGTTPWDKISCLQVADQKTQKSETSKKGQIQPLLDLLHGHTKLQADHASRATMQLLRFFYH